MRGKHKMWNDVHRFFPLSPVEDFLIALFLSFRAGMHAAGEEIGDGEKAARSSKSSHLAVSESQSSGAEARRAHSSIFSYIHEEYTEKKYMRDDILRFVGVFRSLYETLERLLAFSLFAALGFVEKLFF